MASSSNLSHLLILRNISLSISNLLTINKSSSYWLLRLSMLSIALFSLRNISWVTGFSIALILNLGQRGRIISSLILRRVLNVSGHWLTELSVDVLISHWLTFHNLLDCFSLLRNILLNIWIISWFLIVINYFVLSKVSSSPILVQNVSAYSGRVALPYNLIGGQRGTLNISMCYWSWLYVRNRFYWLFILLLYYITLLRLDLLVRLSNVFSVLRNLNWSVALNSGWFVLYHVRVSINNGGSWVLNLCWIAMNLNRRSIFNYVSRLLELLNLNWNLSVREPSSLIFILMKESSYRLYQNWIVTISTVKVHFVLL